MYFGKRDKPVYSFIKKLGSKERAKILSCLKSIQELGFECPRVEFRAIEGKLWEIKIKTMGSGYRIFYVAIKKDIEIAEKRLLEVLNNENLYFG